MHDFAALLALLLAASLSACAAKQSVAPAPTMSVAPEPGMSGGEQRALEAAVEFTPTAIHGAFHNNTESDLEIRTSVRIVGDDWKDAVPPIAGPIVPVRAGASSSPWSIALPPLRDGYHEIMLQTVQRDRRQPDRSIFMSEERSVPAGRWCRRDARRVAASLRCC
ncbi:hypothetical protein OV203_10925 [Nannocystis sp. ILAH1]|uniref:hypothetical protein n=1 Tax=Nannocystis sp. ILAH1 TaxID=2996789 RepID=UPI0022719E0C|nr:hypothetical protein [Nannocystis sp. ILAH1]MCY0987640.1 hypothetical protein [Nannocystis sp. ILAH1]